MAISTGKIHYLSMENCNFYKEKATIFMENGDRNPEFSHE